MGLKKLMKPRTQQGLVIPVLEQYLLNRGTTDPDRVQDTNSPSQSGGCLRARYYQRTHERPDSLIIEPRTQRIFDNGDHVHLRVQSYLQDMGVLHIPELTVVDADYKIFGHTDGLIEVNAETHELGVLEIKSINSNGFSQLYSAKPEHEKQALVYLHCLEKRRQWLRSNKRNAMKNYRSEIESLFQHLQDGDHHTRDEKIKRETDNMVKADDLLFACGVPLTKVVILYECKDTQELKEFVVSSNSLHAKEVIDELLNEFTELNEAVSSKKVPPRPEDAVGKACQRCRWCDFKVACFV